MENNIPINGWNEYKKLVLKQLDGLDAKTSRIEEKLDKLNTKVTILETKAVMWGALAALVVTILVQITISYIK